MRFIFAVLTGLIGMLVGWAGLAALVIVSSGADRDGGIAMGAVFNIGPIGGVLGFVAGVWLFVRVGLKRQAAPPLGAAAPIAGSPVPIPPPPRGTTRISRPFAVIVLAITGGLAGWVWFEFIRSPYLSHGADAEMTLSLQFRLPAGVTLPENAEDVEIDVDDGDWRASTYFGPHWGTSGQWYRQVGGRQILIASAELNKITYWRKLRLRLPNADPQVWTLNMSADPYPIPTYTAWTRAQFPHASDFEMRFRLTADRCATCALDLDPEL